MDRRDLEPRARMREDQSRLQHCYAETFAERFRGVPGILTNKGSTCGWSPKTRGAAPLALPSGVRQFDERSFPRGVPDEYIKPSRHDEMRIGIRIKSSRNGPIDCSRCSRGAALCREARTYLVGRQR